MAQTRFGVIGHKGRMGVALEAAIADAGHVLAAGLDAGDTVAAHVEDTMVAGAGLNHRATVDYVASHASAAIDRRGSASHMSSDIS